MFLSSQGCGFWYTHYPVLSSPSRIHLDGPVGHRGYKSLWGQETGFQPCVF